MAETVEWRNAEGLSIYFQSRAREFSDALVVRNERERAKNKWLQRLQVWETNWMRRLERQNMWVHLEFFMDCIYPKRSSMYRYQEGVPSPGESSAVDRYTRIISILLSIKAIGFGRDSQGKGWQKRQIKGVLRNSYTKEDSAKEAVREQWWRQYSSEKDPERRCGYCIEYCGSSGVMRERTGAPDPWNC